MREIILDTETTGLDPASGHRIVEIGCVEMINRVPTGKTYHQYINPMRDMPDEAYAVHGLSTDFLSKHPTFTEIVKDFIAFIGDSILVIHNASFDMKFINAELKSQGFPRIPMERTIDTVAMARAKFPGAQASLDALCKRFEIDNSSRTKHGALLDAELLAEVYIELTGGRQQGFSLEGEGASGDTQQASSRLKPRMDRPVRPARAHAPTPEELEAHEAFLGLLKDPIWKRA